MTAIVLCSGLHTVKINGTSKFSFRGLAKGITLEFVPAEDRYDTMPCYSLQLRLYVESFSCCTLFVPCEAHLGDQFIDENMFTLRLHLLFMCKISLETNTIASKHLKDKILNTVASKQ